MGSQGVCPFLLGPFSKMGRGGLQPHPLPSLRPPWPLALALMSFKILLDPSVSRCPQSCSRAQSSFLFLKILFIFRERGREVE